MRALALALSLMVAGCAVPPERSEREVALRKAIEPCRQRYPAVEVTGIDAYGHVYAQGASDADGAAFVRCASEAIQRGRIARIGTGRLGAAAAPASVSLQAAESWLLVPVQINGASGRLLLDTGAGKTTIGPELARRAGLHIAPNAPLVGGTAFGGQKVSVPLVRTRSVSVGQALVEGLDIGVFDGLMHRPEVDGLLGNDFLQHFKFTVDRRNLRLLLEPNP
jgi:hypothetical protein